MTNSYIDDNNDNNGHHNYKADFDNGDKLYMITTIMITITEIIMLMIIMMIKILRNIVRISKDIIKVITFCCLIYIIYIYTYISFIINVIKTWWPVSQCILRTISLTLFRSQFKCDGNSVWLCPWSMNHYQIWHCVLRCAKYGSDTVNKG